MTQTKYPREIVARCDQEGRSRLDERRILCFANELLVKLCTLCDKRSSSVGQTSLL